MKKEEDLRQVLAFLSADALAEQTEPEEDPETGADPAPEDPEEDPEEALKEEQPTEEKAATKKTAGPRKRADGRPDRRYKKEALRGKATILMREEELENLEKLAGIDGASVNQLVREAIIDYLQKRTPDLLNGSHVEPVEIDRAHLDEIEEVLNSFETVERSDEE